MQNPNLVQQNLLTVRQPADTLTHQDDSSGWQWHDLATPNQQTIMEGYFLNVTLNFNGLSYVIRKDLCEARVNLEVCSYLADEPPLSDGPPSKLRLDALNTATPNLADEPTLADGPPNESRIDALNTATPKLGWQTYFGQWTPWWINNRCLEYHYTKLGRQTYFGQWTPWWIKNRCLEYCYTKLGRITYFGQWTPPVLTSRWSRMAIGRSASRSTLLGQWIPQLIKNRCLEYCYTKLCRQTYFGQWTPLVLTSTAQKWQLADLPADLPPPPSTYI